MKKNYNDLEIYREAYELAMDIHKLSITLPKYETYEEGSQIRKSSKAVAANIVEGYGRRQYKAEFVRFLIYAISSCDETRVHLNFLHDCNFLDTGLYQSLSEKCDKLGRKLNNFIESVERGHRT